MDPIAWAVIFALFYLAVGAIIVELIDADDGFGSGLFFMVFWPMYVNGKRAVTKYSNYSLDGYTVKRAPKIVYVNEYRGNAFVCHEKAQDAIRCAERRAVRIAVPYREIVD